MCVRPPLEIIAVPPKPWGRFWWLLALSPNAVTSRGSEHDTGWIVARNAAGRERRLFWVPPTELEEKRQRVERELREMPLREWCQKYGVPAEFVGAR
jgi:hypothetical protein